MTRRGPEVYVSIDVETDGPVPGLCSMLSLGAAAFSGEGRLLGLWSANLRELPGARPNAETMRWWAAYPDAWALCRAAPRRPAEAIPEFALWLERLPPGRLVAVAKPAGFDHAFVTWYLWRFADRNPLGYRCLDIRSYAAGLARSDRYSLEASQLRRLAGTVDTRELKAHVAVDDAIEQGRLFMGLLRQARSPQAAGSDGSWKSGRPAAEPTAGVGNARCAAEGISR